MPAPDYGEPDRVEAILRSHVLAEKYGLRRDKISDIFRRPGWTNDGPRSQPEVRLEFIGKGENVPPLRAWLAAATADELVVSDRLGRHWAAQKSSWKLIPTNEEALPP